MKNQTTYNLDYLISIDIFDKIAHRHYFYQEEFIIKTFLGKDKIQPAGFYSFLDYIEERTRLIELSELNQFLIENNIVYHKPHVRLNFHDKIWTEKTFNTYEEALIYYNDIVKKYIKNPLTIK